MSALDPENLDSNDPYHQLLTMFTLKDGEINEDKYEAFCKAFFKPKKFVEFLHSTLCTYPAINDFLIQCLAHANKNQDGFDT